MKRRRLVFAAALGICVCSRGADAPPGDAPLSQTKQQLQALQKDQAAQKAGTGTSVHVDLPTMETPSLGPALELPSAKSRDEKDATKKKDGRQKNWLLDGFDKLDRKKTGAAGNARRGADDTGEGEDDEQPLDPKDPDYFLRVYERQRAASEAKHQLEARAEDSMDAKASAAANDPFAPFMKEWLANSPVREALKESMPAGSGAEPATPAGSLATIEQSAYAGAAPAAVDKSPTIGPANPYVLALGLPAFETKAAEVRSSVSEVSRPAVGPPPAPANPLPEQAERTKQDSRRSLPPAADDDKKYFPQLKKF